MLEVDFGRFTFFALPSMLFVHLKFRSSLPWSVSFFVSFRVFITIIHILITIILDERLLPSIDENCYKFTECRKW